MKVEVVTPEDYMGDIIGDLNSRRGQIQGSEPRGNATAINATVPPREYVRLCVQPSWHVTRPRAVHHAVRALC